MYWVDIGSQNHMGFKGTTQQNHMCTPHGALTAPSKVSFRPHPPFSHLHLAPTLLSLLLSTHCVCASVLYIEIYIYIHTYMIFGYSFHLLSSGPHFSAALTSASLFYASLPLFLFCLSDPPFLLLVLPFFMSLLN